MLPINVKPRNRSSIQHTRKWDKIYGNLETKKTGIDDIGDSGNDYYGMSYKPSVTQNIMK